MPKGIHKPVFVFLDKLGHCFFVRGQYTDGAPFVLTRQTVVFLDISVEDRSKFASGAFWFHGLPFFCGKDQG
jgi:hypothetical protein